VGGLRLFWYQRDYANGLTVLPEWLITCFFVDRRHRSHGVASAALTGALEAIAQAGGGAVEAYPEAFNGREVSKSLPLMASGPMALFERHGFQRARPLGKHHWVVEKVVAPSS
jgi:GNAT superfamily N-acetyltransferase